MTPPKPHGWIAWHPHKGWARNRYVYNKLPYSWQLKRYGEGYLCRPVMLMPPELLEWAEKAKNKLIELNDVGGPPVSRLLAELEEIEKGMK